MKKVFLFAAAAALFAACSETEVLDQTVLQNASNDSGIKFDVYTQRGVTRAGTPGDLTNENIGKIGFGVFAYYTNDEGYSKSATPNFMYNTKVFTSESPATYGTLWKYEPVKYWPNEYGSAAVSDLVDYVSFFAYAPWTNFEPTKGDIIPNDTIDETIEHQQKYNIISVNKNTDTGDPIIKYVVDTDPATSVDLLWGVAAEQAPLDYTAIDTLHNNVEITPGMPFIDLVKPNDPVNDKLVFNLKHALAKVRITIDYIADQVTPLEGTYDSTMYFKAYDANNNIVPTDEKPDTLTRIIDASTTRIFVRDFAIEGWANAGALNLNNQEPGIPLWRDLDGVKELTFSKMLYQDGLKDTHEGTGKIDKGEALIGLNPQIIENYAEPVTDANGKVIAFGDAKNTGVTAMSADIYSLVNDTVIKTTGLKKPARPAIENHDTCATEYGYQGTMLLFGGSTVENDGYFYVIPRNEETEVNVSIGYDVVTIDPSLAMTLQDDLSKGISIQNRISKEAIFGQGVDFEPGKQYDIKIHLGMTSVKVEATVTPWINNGQTTVNLPNNQEPNDTAEAKQTARSFTFTSWSAATGGTQYGSGSGKTIIKNNREVVKGNYIGVTDIQNNIIGGGTYTVPTADADGANYYVDSAAATAAAGTRFELYVWDDTTKQLKPVGIWVAVTMSNN